MRVYEFYDVNHDAHMVRLSVPNERGHEFHATVPSRLEIPVAQYRKLRELAVERLQALAASGAEPGDYTDMVFDEWRTERGRLA